MFFVVDRKELLGRRLGILVNLGDLNVDILETFLEDWVGELVFGKILGVL